MFCSHCGKEVTVGAKFCPNCGTAIESQPAPVGEQPKPPAVKQTGNPIVKEGSSQPGKGKNLIPRPLVIVAAALVLFIGIGAVLNLFGSDDKPTLEPSGSHTTQEESVPYREFNAEEFLSGDVVTGEIIYIDKEENETPVSLGNAMLLVYEKGVIERFFNTTKEDGVTWKLVKKCLEDDWFNSEIKCVELDYISGVQWNDKTYDYFRMNVSDLDGLNSKFEYDSDWLSGKEIYIIARASMTSNSLTNEEGTQIQYFINQFDDNITPTSNPNSQYPNEVAVNNSGTVVVETDYYTIDIPGEWEEYCSCEQFPGAGEHFLTFTVKDKYLEEHSDNILFELAAIPSPEFFPSYYDNEQYSYICRICKDGAFMLNLMQRFPDDIQVKEQYQDLLATLQEFIPYVVQSIEEKDGFTLSYEPIEVDDGIPYVDTWIEILGTTLMTNLWCKHCCTAL